jgi:radical SAM protein with 4Fe4S-binding SPASM domain
MDFVPYLISWNLTRRCNLRCRHCYIDASRAMPGELNTQEALRVLDEIAEVSPETMLILTGGEPLMRDDLDTIVERASALGMTVVLGTNATLLTFDRAAKLAERGLAAVGISLDSLVASRHDDFRGRQGAWEAAVAGVESARRAGLDVQIQMTLTRDNLEELPQVVGFTRDAGARVLTVFFLVCTGRGQDLVDLTPGEYERALRLLARQQEETSNGVMIRPRCAPTFRRVLAQTKPDSILLKSDAGRCLAGRNYCRITPDGQVTPCPYLPVTAGNLREHCFGEIWRSASVFETLRSSALNGRCGVCEYDDLCGGCRARAFALRGHVLEEDPWCTYVPGTDKRPENRPETPLTWTADAEARLKKVPFFVRRVVRSAVEEFARRAGADAVTTALMSEARATMKKP